jgi:hypothetical protein
LYGYFLFFFIFFSKPHCNICSSRCGNFLCVQEDADDVGKKYRIEEKVLATAVFVSSEIAFLEMMFSKDVVVILVVNIVRLGVKIFASP